FLALCTAMAAAWIAVITGIMPFVESQRPMKPLALSLRAALAPGDRIVGYRIIVFASLIYYTGHHVHWVENPGALRAELSAPGRVFVVLPSEDFAELKRTLPVCLSVFAQRSGMVVLRKQPADKCPSAWRAGRSVHRYARWGRT